MSSTMYILGWKAQGLRCPDHEIDCRDSAGTPRSITLIQMPNGTGKTTTLSLLRAALSGSATNEQWSRARVMEFQKRGGSDPSGLFELRLLLNDKRVTIILDFDFEYGRIYYKTTRAHGQIEGFDPPADFRRFMNEDFVKFYVFDGELADNLLSREHTDAQKAVESLFQIHLLEKLSQKISEYWDEQTRNVTAKDQTGYTRRTNRLDKWRSRQHELEQRQSDYKSELAIVNNNLLEQQAKYDNQIKKEADRAERMRAAETSVAKLEQSVHESAQGVLDTIRDPHAISPRFASAMYELKQGLDRVKLPESAAREFFEELAEEETCVCGRPIDPQTKLAIKERARQYLGSDDVSLLNNMKSAITEAVGQSRSAAANELSRAIDALSDKVGAERKARNELDDLKLDAERSDPDVMHAKEEIDRLAAERDHLEAELDCFDGKDEMIRFDRIGSIDPDRISSIETIREGVGILEEQVEEAAGTLSLRRKRNILTAILGEAHNGARHHIASEIKDETNRRITMLMPDNRIRIEEIDHCIVLKGQASGSAGENLSVAYAFLATLFNRSGEHELPFIVDSPANPIDYDIRSKIGQLAPALAEQFIAFVISSEREKFLPSLQRATDKEIKYITLFRKGATRHEDKAAQQPGCVQTSDSFQVVSEAFFSEFQLDSEEE